MHRLSPQHLPPGPRPEPPPAVPAALRSSVLINTRNHGRYLEECIASVLAQTQPADEIIVCDNESTDGTAAVLARQAGRVRALSSEHRAEEPGRVNQARSVYEAFRHSTGDVVFLLDGDDLFAPGKIAQVMAAFAEEPAPVLVQSPMRWIDGEGRPLVRLAEPFRHVTDPLAEAYRRHDVDFFYPTSGLAFSRGFLAQQLPLDFSDGIALAADTRLCVVALLHGRIVTLPDELGAWRRHGDSMSVRLMHRRYHLALEAWRRVAIFNRHCRASGRPGIAAWRSERFYLRWFRALAPASVSAGRKWVVRA